MIIIAIGEYLKHYGKLVLVGFNVNSDNLKIKWIVKQPEKILLRNSILCIHTFVYIK